MNHCLHRTDLQRYDTRPELMGLLTGGMSTFVNNFPEVFARNNGGSQNKLPINERDWHVYYKTERVCLPAPDNAAAAA